MCIFCPHFLLPRPHVSHPTVTTLMFRISLNACIEFGSAAELTPTHAATTNFTGVAQRATSHSSLYALHCHRWPKLALSLYGHYLYARVSSDVHS